MSRLDTLRESVREIRNRQRAGLKISWEEVETLLEAIAALEIKLRALVGLSEARKAARE